MNIEKNEKPFSPVIKISYAFVEDINAITYNPDNTVSIVFNPSKNWYKFYGTRTSINFAENQKRVKEGILTEQKIDFKIYGDEKDNNAAINDVINRSIVLKIDFTDGKSKLIGDKENPVKLIYDSKIADYKNFKTIKISRQSIETAPFIS